MKKSFHFGLRVALVLAPLAQGVAILAQTQSTAPSNHAELALERHLTLSPSSDNRRNSEGDFVHLKNGRWLFIYTHFTSGTKDHSNAFLASRESSDGGKSWTDKDKIVVANEGGFNVMSVSLVRLKSGEIALFYLRKNSLQDCRPVMRLSRDEAKTWSAPVECITDEIGYYVLNNCRVIQLAGGRLILPTALHAFDHKRLQPGTIVVYLSDDAGKSWRRSASRDRPGCEQHTHQFYGTWRRGSLGRSTADGDSHRARSSVSKRIERQRRNVDDATSKRPAIAHSAGHARANPLDGRLARRVEQSRWAARIRASSPTAAPHTASCRHFARRGATWVNHRNIEAQPDHGYCYTAVAFAGDRVLLGYCAHPSPSGLETTQISSFAVQDLYR